MQYSNAVFPQQTLKLGAPHGYMYIYTYMYIVLRQRTKKRVEFDSLNCYWVRAYNAYKCEATTCTYMCTCICS